MCTVCVGRPNVSKIATDVVPFYKSLKVSYESSIVSRIRAPLIISSTETKRMTVEVDMDTAATATRSKY